MEGLIVGIIIVYSLIFAIACSYIATSKNRDSTGYFFVGLLLGFIGLIIAAAVPKLDLQDRGPTDKNDVKCIYLDAGSVIDKGLLKVTDDGIKFTSIRSWGNNRYGTVFPFASIKNVSLVPGHSTAVLSFKYQGTDGLVEASFKGPKRALSDLFSNRINPMLDRAGKSCPYCAETIKAEAVVCRFCGRDLEKPEAPDPAQPSGTITG